MFSRFTFPSPTAFFADMDGIRVFTRNETILLHSIPAQAKAVLSLGSDKPGALLFNAFLKLEQRSHVAYELEINFKYLIVNNYMNF
jgi:hypothetical protein